jgi:hypothetical protein
VADVLSKHWGFQQAWPVLKPLLFWQRDTSNCEVKTFKTTKQADGECYGMPPCDMSHGHDSPNMDITSVNQNYAHGVKEARTEMLSALFCGHVDSQ